MRSKRIWVLIVLVILMSSFYGCGWKRDLQWRARGHQPVWFPEDEAIQLLVKADPELNLYDNRPHTLFVCVYQLKDISMFRQYTASDEMIYELLGNNCGFKDGVVISRSLTIHPGTEAVFPIHRMEDTRYVAIVAGYSKPSKEGSVRDKEIPVLVKKSLFSTRVRPGRLNLEIHFGPEGIMKFKEG